MPPVPMLDFLAELAGQTPPRRVAAAMATPDDLFRGDPPVGKLVRFFAVDFLSAG